ncbi:MAG: hypothetical protein FJ261_07235 [Planctomycetes bacterium]|nr:hypothetical protein [Planctomycetota bacterium]
MGPFLERLLRCFPDEPAIEPDYPKIIPEPYSGLLAHDHHMTVALERHHGYPVEVTILQSRISGEEYHRRIVLTTRGSSKVVLYGLVRLQLSLVPREAREEILEEKKPLGRVLIERSVLRRVEHMALLRFSSRPVDMARFELSGPCQLYGRLAYLHCDDKPAIELLEVVRP